MLDNLPVHKVAGLAHLIEACGARLLFLLPYLPDFVSIEQAWSKLKTRYGSDLHQEGPETCSWQALAWSTTEDV